MKMLAALMLALAMTLPALAGDMKMDKATAKQSPTTCRWRMPSIP